MLLEDGQVSVPAPVSVSQTKVTEAAGFDCGCFLTNRLKEPFRLQDPRLAVFLPHGLYSTWEAAAAGQERLSAAAGADTDADLSVRLQDLQTFLGLVAGALDCRHADTVILFSTSLEGIYDRLRQASALGNS